METAKIFPEPGTNEIFIEINGLRMSLVCEYICRTEFIPEEVDEETGEKTAETVVYKIELKRMLSHGEYNDGIDFYKLKNFNISFLKNNMRILFSDCKWEEITEAGSASDGVFETAVISAEQRTVLEF